MDINQVAVWIQIGAKLMPIASTAIETGTELISAVKQALEERGVEVDNQTLTIIEAEAEARASARRVEAGETPDA